MAIDGQIADEKLQYDINREGEKIPADDNHLEKLINVNILQMKKYYSWSKKNDRIS